MRSRGVTRAARSLPAVMGLWLGASACGSGEPPGHRRYTLGDTLVVESLTPLIADTLHPVEVARYGTVDGPVEEVIDRISVFAVGTDGTVFVHDGAGGIRAFAVDGTFSGWVAREGEGPDEVGYAVELAVAADGRVAALDFQNRRVSVFAPGEASWSTPMPGGRPSFRAGSLTFHEDGSLWVGMIPQFPEDGAIAHPRPIAVHPDPGGRFVDTVYTPGWIAGPCPTLSRIEHQAGFWEDRREPFVPKAQWALGPDGTLAVGCPASYRFYLLHPDGGITRIARAHDPVEVSKEERDWRAGLPVPKAEATLPAYVRLILPGDGRVWVWPRPPDVKEPVEPELAARYGVTYTWTIPWQGAFDVFDEHGNWLAVVRIPTAAWYSGYPTTPPAVVRGDTIWLVEKDELEVETIVRYEVPGLSRGAP